MQWFQLADLLAATGGSLSGTTTQSKFTSIQLDSRQVQPGDLFWALKGQQHDSHQFLHQAFAAGAHAAVVESRQCAPEQGPCIVVRNTLQALTDFARWNRRYSDALVIGVTGSVGKTTTREMIYSALRMRFPGIRSAKNYNNHIGLPLTLLELQPEHEFAVVEMGASHLGEIASLSATALPEVGVVTAVAAAHLEGFGSLEQIVTAKGELIAALPSEGFAVLTGDDPLVAGMADRARCSVIFTGEQAHNHIRARNVHTSNGQLQFQVDQQQYSLPIAGRHHLNAALAAIAIAREVGMQHAEISDGLRQFVPVAGRCQVRELGPWTIIDDTYNANPESMRAACRLLHEWKTAGRKILVAGDMLELGPDASIWHQRLGADAAGLRFDRLLTYGNYAGDVVQGALEAGMPRETIAECVDFEALLMVLDCWLEPGDVVLVKGSRGMQMERVVDWIQTRLPAACPEWINEDFENTTACVPTRVCA